tara:strand:+ start:166 stop:279 length:114 start_codon:yes stop_codon:yes gene_type:complete
MFEGGLSARNNRFNLIPFDDLYGASRGGISAGIKSEE